MSESKTNFVLRKESIGLLMVLLLAGAVARCFGARTGTEERTIPRATKENEEKLIAVLKSDASREDKAGACRELAVIGTKEAVEPLAGLLGDENLSHMARYGLEPMPYPAVDEVFRDALGRLKGLPLVGVIGSIGVRRDVKAVEPLAEMLQDSDNQVAQAAARALGKIGNRPAAEALRRALPNVSATNRLSFCEGLFRCAEALAADGRSDDAVAIYDQMRKLESPHQVRGGALRGAILTRGKDGVALLREYLGSDDYIMFSAAVQTAQEMPGAEVTEALTAELGRLPADNQILVIQTLGKRADIAALPALFTAAGSGAKSVRIAAIEALPDIGHASAVPVLVELLGDADNEISEAGQEALGALPGREADDAVMAMLNSSETGRRLTALELIGRRRMTASIPALVKAADDADPRVRPAAIRKLGELGGSAELPVLLNLLMRMESSQDLDAARQALSDVCTKADDPESHVERLTGLLAEARPAQKSVLLRVLSSIGGADALRAVRAAANDSNALVRTAAIRALGAWKTADAASHLLALAKTAGSQNERTLCLRGYLGLAARGDVPTSQRLLMCKQAAGLIQRDEEKKLLLGVLGSINSPRAVTLIMLYLDEPATREEACMAFVTLAERLMKRRSGSKLGPQLIEPLEKAARLTTNTDLARRAKVLLRQARKTGDRR